MNTKRNWVCESCYKRGLCDSWPRCTCPCTKGEWQHADDPRIGQVFELEEGVEY